MKWIFPISVVWFFFVFSVVPTYESQINYFVSISSILFLVQNVAFSWVASLFFAIKFSQNGTNAEKIIGVFLGLILNVWGQYHFSSVPPPFDFRMGVHVPLPFEWLSL